MPSKLANQSMDVGQMDKISNIIQNIIQMNELPTLSLFFLIE